MMRVSFATTMENYVAFNKHVVMTNGRYRDGVFVYQWLFAIAMAFETITGSSSHNNRPMRLARLQRTQRTPQLSFSGLQLRVSISSRTRAWPVTFGSAPP